MLRMKQRESIGVWVALAILAIVAVLAYRSIDATADTLDWLEHNHHIMRQYEDVSAAYARAASARRAYVVAGDDSQLADGPNLDARLTHALADLRTSLSDDPEALRQLDQLAPLFDQRLAALRAAVERRRAEGSAVETAEGLALVAQIRDVREAMERSQNRQLADRDARTRRNVAQTKLAEIVGTGASFAILLFAFGRLRQEIGRRRQSEAALRTSEGFLDSILENIPNMLFVKEAGDLRFERINRAGEELLGIPRTELLRKSDFDFFPRSQAESFVARDREVLDGRVAVDIEEEAIQTKQGERWLHTKKVPIFDEDGRPKYLLGISEDITERREAATALKTARDSAQAANKELEAFSYSVAHDLRAPLRAIDGYSEALEEDLAGTLDPSSVAHLKRVRSSVRLMAELIDGLLGLSRVTRGGLVRAKVDVTRMVRECLARLHDTQPEREVVSVVEEGLVTEADPRLLMAAFDNLLGNAWKFSGKSPSPRIEVGKTVKEGQTFFFVRDNGVGFDQAYASKLFVAFQRLHGVNEFEGTGIGLATVQRIVLRHGGSIYAEGKVDHGATLYFTV
jgi:PAS domain S-box-containing protein